MKQDGQVSTQKTIAFQSLYGGNATLLQPNLCVSNKCVSLLVRVLNYSLTTSSWWSRIWNECSITEYNEQKQIIQKANNRWLPLSASPVLKVGCSVWDTLNSPDAVCFLSDFSKLFLRSSNSSRTDSTELWLLLLLIALIRTLSLPVRREPSGEEGVDSEDTVLEPMLPRPNDT